VQGEKQKEKKKKKRVTRFFGSRGSKEKTGFRIKKKEKRWGGGKVSRSARSEEGKPALAENQKGGCLFRRRKKRGSIGKIPPATRGGTGRGEKGCYRLDKLSGNFIPLSGKLEGG